MDKNLTKKLKACDGLPKAVGEDNVSQRLEHNIDGLADGSVGNSKAYKADGRNESYITRDNVVGVGLSKEGNIVSGNTMPAVNFTSYVEASAVDTSIGPIAVYGGQGFPSDVSALDEKQLKRERRKQANRESARKSRMRKQSEYEELVGRWDYLKAENESLKSELERLNADSEKVRRENAALMEKLENSGVKNRETVSGTMEADLTKTCETEKVQENSDRLGPNVGSDRNKPENSNSEAKLHQLLQSGSRTDSVAAR